MRNWILALMWLSLGSDCWAAAATYRFQALINFDHDAQTGCDVQTAAGAMHGNEARVFAVTDRERVTSVVMESCRQGGWHEDSRSEPNQGIDFGQGQLGSDLIVWSVSHSLFGAHAQVPIQLLAEQPAAQVFDFLARDGNISTLNLELGGTAQPIPTVRWSGLAILAATVFWFSRRRLRTNAKQFAPLLLMGSMLFAYGAGEPVASSNQAVSSQTSATTIEAQDPANDVLGGDAGVDLVHAQVSANAEQITFRVAVNNIQDDALADHAKVLFVGNSLTYFNDLPEMLKAIAAQAGKNVITHAVTIGGANLEDHYRARTALNEIARGHYHLVILQQGPSSLIESQQDLLDWTLRFNAPIRASGARPALYMVWPESARLAYFDAVRASYSNAALAVNGMFIPAGEAWRAGWRVDPDLPLYGSDQFHPSPLGSYAAALSMFAELYRQTPVGLPSRLTLSNGQTLQFPDSHARILQESAWVAHLQYGRAGE